MSGTLSGLGPRGTALALLVLGHVLADFAFQSDWMLENKDRAPGLLTAPWCSPPTPSHWPRC